MRNAIYSSSQCIAFPSVRVHLEMKLKQIACAVSSDMHMQAACCSHRSVDYRAYLLCDGRGDVTPGVTVYLDVIID
jgi:hypothetical protein